MLTISICLTQTKNVSFELISICSKKTIELMEISIRNRYARNNLKRAIKLYCNYFELKSIEIEQMAGFLDDDLNEWKDLLYTIVISLIKILRCDFESNELVDEELVIYFYEILIVN